MTPFRLIECIISGMLLKDLSHCFRAPEQGRSKVRVLGQVVSRIPFTTSNLWHLKEREISKFIRRGLRRLLRDLWGCMSVMFSFISTPFMDFLFCPTQGSSGQGSKKNILHPVLPLFSLGRGAYHGCSPYTIGLTNVGFYKMRIPTGMGCRSVSLEIFVSFL